MKKTLKKSKKAGRKPLPAGEVRGIDVRIRVTQEEKATLFATAEREGLSLSNWIRVRLGLDPSIYWSV